MTNSSINGVEIPFKTNHFTNSIFQNVLINGQKVDSLQKTED